MLVEELKKLPTKERYLFWVKEREEIRLKRAEGLPKPWSSNEIFQKFKFCNVRRMDDRVSNWLLHNWYEPFFDHKNMLTACVIARLLNNTDSLGELGFPKTWNPARMEKLLEARTVSGAKNFSGAYLVSGSKGITKVKHVVWNVINPLHCAKLKVDTTSLEMLVKTLTGFMGLGSFMAGQVSADMRWAVSGTWADKDTFAPIGPGSRRGMNRLHERPLLQPIKDSVFMQELAGVKALCLDNLPLSLTCRLEAIDYQNSLCEMDKMERTLWEGRRPKQLYPGV